MTPHLTFFSSQNAFTTASTILGTLIGFITGIYIPIGSLPEAVQLIVKIFPISHAGALFRQVIMEKPMSVSFQNASPEAVESFSKSMGVTFQFGDTTAGVPAGIIVLIATAVVYYGLAVLNISVKKNN